METPEPPKKMIRFCRKSGIFFGRNEEKRDALIGIIKEFLFLKKSCFYDRCNFTKTGEFIEARTHLGRRWDGGLKKIQCIFWGKCFYGVGQQDCPATNITRISYEKKIK